MKHLVNRRWWSALLLVAASILLYKVLDNLGALWSGLGTLMGVFTPFIGGFVLAFLLYRPARALERRFARSRYRAISGPARAWGMLVSYLALFAALSVLVGVIVSVAVPGVSGLIASMPGYYNTAMEFLNTHGNGKLLFGVIDLTEIVQQVFTFVRDHLTVSNVLGYLSGLWSFASSFVSVLVMVIVSIYMLAGAESLLATAHRLFSAVLPERVVSTAGMYLRQSGEIFSRYVYTMLLDALCICIMVLPGMFISGIPYPLAFAVFIGFANLIPYFGALTSGCASVLVLVLSGKWGMAVFLAVYILVAQQIDCNFVQPRIYGRSLGVKPIYVLLAVTLGGRIAGFAGILLGVPVMAVAQMLVKDFVEWREKKAALQSAEEEL